MLDIGVLHMEESVVQMYHDKLIIFQVVRQGKKRIKSWDQQVYTVGDRSKIFLFVNFHLYKFYFYDLFPQHSPVKHRRKYRI